MLQTGSLVALVIGLPLVVFVGQVAPLIGAVGLLAVLTLSFHDLARIDRRAFVSIAIPVAAVALLGFALPWRLALAVDEAAALFLALFAFARGSFVPWWWRTILRRPKVAFALALTAQIDELTWLSRRVLTGADASEKSLVALEEQMVRLRSLPSPDADWAELRDAYAAEFVSMLELGQRAAGADEYRDMVPHAEALRARFDDLVARGG